MHSRKKASSADGMEMVVSKTGRRNVTKGNAKNLKSSTRREESVLEKWRGALVKARLALRKKREKKKEQRVKSTLARLRKIADSARKPQGLDEEDLPQKSVLPARRRGRPPLATKAGKARALGSAVPAERTSRKVLKKGSTTSGRSEADDGELKEPVPSVTKVKRGRKPSSITSTTCREEADVATLSAEMERKEEIRNKWRNALQIARSALQQKRARRKEQAAMRRLRRSQDGAVQDDTAQVFSLKRPSLEELRNFAKKSRC
ncbi:unnamed protein product [Calypogeia fissa]